MSMEAVDYVFKVLAATYGAEWDRSMGTAPLADVKSVWADALDGYTQSDAAKRSILWALKNLPDRAPNSRQFVALCRLAPAPVTPRLEAPKADPERIAIELEKLASIRQRKVGARVDGRDWARRIIARHESGARLNPTTLRFAHEAMQGGAA